MFAIVVERSPLELKHVPFLALSWLEVVGGIALLALIGFGISRLAVRKSSGSGSATFGTGLSAAILLSLICFAVGGAMEGMARSGNQRFAQSPLLVHSIMAAGGLFAILGILGPVLHNLTQISPRRVWALARLSFKEALRRRILLAFSIILVGFLFAGWFLSSKPEHQLATYVRFTFFMMSVFLLLIAGLLASFGIPSDLKTQTMYTIVTKPVERFEIVLGRCLGYTMLMTAVLGAMSLLSLIYVARGIDPDAVVESYKARVPIFAPEGKDAQGKDLYFQVPKGVSVGREWEYRQYIQGGVTDDEAIWLFPSLASNLASRTEPVPCEFAFDIFRTTKGKEGRAIRCSFIFTNSKWDPKNEPAYKAALEASLENPDPAIETEVQAEAARDGNWSEEKKQNVLHARRRDKVAEQFGIYERLSKEVTDYHTLSVAVPAGLFKSVNETPASGAPALTIRVRCEDATQYLGVARHDLYLLNAERPFWLNFFKGSVGLWCRLVLVIVIAVTLSTYLSGIVSFLTTMFLYGAGLIVSFIQEVALGRTQGGGPFEAFLRLARGANLMAPLEQTATIKAAVFFDIVFRFLMRPFLLIIPDVERYDLSNYVAQGFDVSGAQILADNIVPLAGYLIPWLVLSFYLMRSREIAS